MILLLLLLQAPSFGPPPEPPPPPPMLPCTSDPGANCAVFTMVVDSPLPRMFTQADLGVPLDTIEPSAICQGRLAKGKFRYYANGTAPSSMVGILVPSQVDPVPDEVPDGIGDTENTLEPGDLINLYSRDLILGFKATQADWAGAEITWECRL